ncbi:DUF761 domain protein [Senna tora]|uniref:DUF761 domain protein n=1 Tax=Senna tora TaxID=362788 RepID=A0A834XF71_9FABA|nr:DUF761 domain protein [Senna tora]
MRSCYKYKQQANYKKEEEGKKMMRCEKNESGGAETKKTIEKQTTTTTASEDIDASAEAFIKNFRHHLLIQRLQSMENYARGL